MLCPAALRRLCIPLWCLTLSLTLPSAEAAPATQATQATQATRVTASWADTLRAEVERIDRRANGTLGVYVKRLDTGQTMEHQAGRRWYLGSSAKLPVAIAVLQEVDAGRLSNSQTLTLQESDRIDGSQMSKQGAGATADLQTLLSRMLGDSDNGAANMLIRTLGLDLLNDRAHAFMGADALGRLTDFTQVRQAVYGQLHPAAEQLSNQDLLQLAAVPLGQRVQVLRQKLKLQGSDLRLQTMPQAYDAFYASGVNSATLSGYGQMLEQLVLGKLLSPASMQQLYVDMKFNTYDAYRLEAGLPNTVRFIHKTGTQWRRACHMGVIQPQLGARGAIVVASCAEGLDEHKDAPVVFEQLGRAITRSLLPGHVPGRTPVR